MTQQIGVSNTGAYYDWDLSAAQVTLAGGAGYAFGLNVPTEPSNNIIGWDYRLPLDTKPSSAVGFVSVGMVSSVSGSWLPPSTAGNPGFQLGAAQAPLPGTLALMRFGVGALRRRRRIRG